MKITRSIYWTGTLLLLFVLASGCASKTDEKSTTVGETAADGLPLTINQDHETALEHLTANDDRFIAMIADLSPEQLAYRESDERWSIAEVAEHLIKSEMALGAGLDSTLASDPVDVIPDSLSSAESVKNLFADRSTKYQAPDDFQPTGLYTTAEEIAEAWTSARGETIADVTSFEGDLRSHLNQSPALGNMDAYTLVVFITSHADRHIEQMQQVKDHPGYASI